MSIELEKAISDFYSITLLKLFLEVINGLITKIFNCFFFSLYFL